MIRAVLDTNVIVSAIIGRKHSPSLKIFESFKNQKFVLVTSVGILEEVEGVINRERVVKFHGFSPSRRSKIIIDLAELSCVVPGASTIEAVKEDPDDDKFLACALEAKASYIVSGDKHLLKLKKFEGMKIATPREFIEILKNDN